METLAEKKSCREKCRHSISASGCKNTKRQIKRPICYTAFTFLAVTALFIPLYEIFLQEKTLMHRCVTVGMIVLGMIFAVNIMFYGVRQKKAASVFALIALSAAAALTTNFYAMEKTAACVKHFEGEPTIEAQVLEWEVTDYGCKYLIRTADNSDLPKGLKARLYSFEEPVADVGDIIGFTAPIVTEIGNYDRGRNIFFYVFAGANPIDLMQEKRTLRSQIMEETRMLYHAPVLGIVEGVLFGEKGNLEQPFQAMLHNVGLLHILAVSGIHITLVAAFCTRLFTKLGIPERFAGLFSLLPVWGYISLAQFSPSAVRAGIMTSLYVLGTLLHRDRDSLSAWSAAVIFILADAPFSLYSVSFQFSFWITLGVILCANPLTWLLCHTRPIRYVMGRCGVRTEKWIRSGCAVAAMSIVASVFSAPLMLYYYHAAAVWSVLAAVLSLWAVMPLMIFSVVSILLGFLYHALNWSILLAAAKAAAGIAGIFARWILLVSKGISMIPKVLFYSHSVVDLLCSVVCILLLLLLVYRFGKITTKARRIRARCWIYASVFLICMSQAAQLWANQGVLNIFVTENATILTRDGQGAVVGDIVSGYEADEIASILHCEGVEKLELLFCDSKDTDESAGIDLLLTEFPAKVVAVPQGQFYEHIKKAANGREIVSPEGISAQLLGGVTIQQTQEETSLFVKEKKLLKNGQNYAIMEKENQHVGAGQFPVLRDQPVLKIQMDGKAGT